MRSVGKLATPATSATVVVPERVPPTVFVPSATVTLPEKPGTVLPDSSCAATWTAGAIAAPAVVASGSTVNTRRVAGPGAMSKGALVVPSPAAVANSV
jgi:hypothetical protein